jgi:hypothetical protein
MHCSSQLNRQGKQPVEVSFFSAFSNWRCGSSSLEDDFTHPTLISPSTTVQSEISCPSQNDGSRKQDDATNQFRSSGHHNSDRRPTTSSFKTDYRNSANQDFFSEHSYEQDKFTKKIGRTVSPSKSSIQSISVSLKKVNAIALCCDKCDGKHDTDSCPHYKKKRESHLDGQRNGWKLVGGSSNLPGKFLICFFCL